MPVQFAVLASGSAGNAALVQAEGAGLLIDLGLGPRALAQRLESVGSGWGRIGAALLTHTHGDHIQEATLHALARRQVPLFCHEGHRAGLARREGFRALEAAGAVRHFDEHPLMLPCGLRVEPFALRHDGGPTFGFRIEGRGDRRGRSVAIGYMADTGSWSEAMVEALADVDLLGVEFNHDVEMQLQSGRPRHLIARNLGDRGHLSNEQGSSLLEAVFARSHAGAVRHVVLLHLSEQCNRPALALGAARAAARRAGRRATIHAASQWSAHPDLRLIPGRKPRPKPAAESGFPWEAA